VLIRLPDLSESPKKEKATETTVLIEQDDALETVPEPVIQSSVETQSGGQRREEADPVVDDRSRVPASSTGVRDESHVRGEKPHVLEESGVLRVVLQAAIAVALIGTFITLYVLIVDGRDSGTVVEPGHEKTGDQGTSGLPDGGFPVQHSEPADIGIVPPAASDGHGQQSFGSIFPPEGNVDTRDATSNLNRPHAKTGGVAGPLVDGRSQTGSVNSTGQGQAGEDSALSDRQRFGLPSQGYEQDPSRPERNAADSFPGNDPSPPGQTVDASPYKYPVTKPSTFQYPEEYHMQLRPSPVLNDSGQFSPASGRRGEYTEYDRHHSSARLQPKIQPPPVR